MRTSTMRIRHAVAAAAVVLIPAIYLTVLSAADSPVADAAMKGDKAAVQTLLKQKADVNLPQADGATAIQWAAYRNDVDIADLQVRCRDQPPLCRPLVVRRASEPLSAPHFDLNGPFGR